MTLTLIRKRMLIGVFTSTTKKSVENYETRHTHTYSILVVNFKFWLCQLQKHHLKHKCNWNENDDRSHSFKCDSYLNLVFGSNIIYIVGQ